MQVSPVWAARAWPWVALHVALTGLLVSGLSAAPAAVAAGPVRAAAPALGRVVVEPRDCPTTRPARNACYRGLAKRALPQVWAPALTELAVSFRPARIVVFTDPPRTACTDGPAVFESAVYCAEDETVYLPRGLQEDFSRFYARDLAARPGQLRRQAARLGVAVDRLRRGGSYGVVWEMAHEYAHHLQHLLGWDAWLETAAVAAAPADRERLRAAAELGADCLAGAFTRGATGTGAFPASRFDVWSAKATIVELQLNLRVGVGFAPFLPVTDPRGPVQRSSAGHGSTRQRLWSYDLGRSMTDLSAAPGACAAAAARITTAPAVPPAPVRR